MKKGAIRIIELAFICLVILFTGYLLFCACDILYEHSLLKRIVADMRLIGDETENYILKSGKFPETMTMQKLIDELKLDSSQIDKLKSNRFFDDMLEMSYQRSSDGKNAFLIWQSPQKMYISPSLSNIMRSYHYEVSRKIGGGITTSRVWDE